MNYRAPLLLIAGLTLSACSNGADSFSYAGLDYFNSSASFSGLPLTSAAMMPTTNATYQGRYSVEDGNGFDGSGDASLALNFTTSSANLTLTGDVVGTIPGSITGTSVRSNSFGLTSFDGDFYGTNGEVVGGTFKQVSGSSTDTLDGAYIVSR